MGFEKVYRERANGLWEFWTYSDSQRVYISRKQANKMISQGARIIYVN